MTNMKVVCRVAALAVTLVAGGLASARPAAATDTIISHGLWSSVVDTYRGHPLCGVRTKMNYGGELRLMVLNDRINLVAYDPRWRMVPDAVTRVSISIDDEMFSGRATAVDGQTLVVESLTESFLDHFVGGSDLAADFGGVRWNVDLDGSSGATDDMMDCVRYVRSRLQS